MVPTVLVTIGLAATVSALALKQSAFTNYLKHEGMGVIDGATDVLWWMACLGLLLLVHTVLLARFRSENWRNFGYLISGVYLAGTLLATVALANPKSVFEGTCALLCRPVHVTSDEYGRFAVAAAVSAISPLMTLGAMVWLIMNRPR